MPDEWTSATVWTLHEVDPRDLVHPLHDALWTACRGSSGLPQQLPTAAQLTRLVPVGEQAIMPETDETVGQHMQEEATDTFVHVERHGLEPIARTAIPIGQADFPVPHVKDPMVRDGDAMGITADIV